MKSPTEVTKNIVRKVLASLDMRIVTGVSKELPYKISLLYPVDEKPRYGHGKPPHEKLYEILDQERSSYEFWLNKFLEYKDDFTQIPKGEGDLQELPGQPTEPFWLNKFLPGLDAIALYGLLSTYNPSRYFEIGSGNSTKFARKAVKNRGLKTEITSFDPWPRAEVDSICDKLIRVGVENVDASVFDELEAGDVLFVDCSHTLFMNSDVCVVFLDILHRLKPGVLVGVHDIFLPYDYPPEWVKLHYSEQYMLAVHLLSGSEKYRLILPCAFVSKDEKLSYILIDNLWKTPEMDDGKNKIKPWINWLWEGSSFWFETK